MENFLNIIIQSLYSTSKLEAIAMVLSILYLFLAIRESLWCWVAAFFSTFIYTIIFFDASLIMDSFLNFYYLIMAIYGWYSWRYTNNLEKNKELEISTLTFSSNIKFILLLSILSFILGYYMANYTNAAFAYMDTFTTVFAVFSTYLLAKKIVETWLYWVIIDSVSIYIYIQKGFYLTALLFIIYTILAILAYSQWKKEYAKIIT